MKNKLVKEIIIPSGMCDHHSKLSIADHFTLIMDLATEHGSSLGLGRPDLEQKGLIWLITKTKIRLIHRPEMLQKITAATWPAPPGKFQCIRYYTLTDGATLLAEAKNEWVMLEVATGRLHRPADAYPDGIDHCPDTVCDTRFCRPATDFSEAKLLGEYTVRSTDIDGSRHMNNVAYVRQVLGAFSCKQLEEMNISEVEVAYRAQCYEGETLSFRIREIQSGHQIGVIKADGTAAILTLTCKTQPEN